jgi:hypothetical protein
MDKKQPNNRWQCIAFEMASHCIAHHIAQFVDRLGLSENWVTERTRLEATLW